MFVCFVCMATMVTINRMRQYVWVPRISFYAGYYSKDRGNCLVCENVWRGLQFVVTNHSYSTDFD
jgi:hypothetical protein